MRYMLLIYESEAAQAGRSAEEETALVRGHTALIAELRQSGHFEGGEPLHTTDSATTVRVRGRQTAVTDGPFSDTAEQLQGFYLVNGANLDEAIAIATRIPTARAGCIEIRPIREGVTDDMAMDMLTA